MPVFEIALEDGRKLRVDADDQQAALAGVQQFISQSSTTGAAPKDAPKSESFTDALRHGVSNVVGGLGETIEQYGSKNAVSDTLKSMGETARPENYDPARVFSREEGFTPGDAPRMLAEGAPGLGMDIAAGATAGKLAARAPGGIVGKGLAASLGAALSYLARTRGHEAQASADARTGQEGSEVTTADRVRSAAYGVPEAALNTLGAGRFLPGAGRVTSVGTQGVKDATKEYGRRVATEAATEAGQDVIAQTGRTVGTEGGTRVDPYDVANAAAGGLVTAGGMATPRLAKDVTGSVTNRKYGGANSEAAASVADDIVEASGGADALKPSFFNSRSNDAFNAVRAAAEKNETELSNELSGQKNLSPRVSSILDRAKRGDTVTERDIQAVESELPNSSVARLARKSLVMSRLKAEGRYDAGSEQFSGGITRRVLDAIPGSGFTKLVTGAGLSAAGIAGNLILPSPTLAAVTAGSAAGARLIDQATGAAQPAHRFVERFAGTGKPQQVPAVSTAPRTTSVPQVAPAPTPWGVEPPAEQKYDPRTNIVIDEGIARIAKQVARDRDNSAKKTEAEIKRILKAQKAREKITDIPAFLPNREGANVTELPSFLPNRNEQPAAPPPGTLPKEVLDAAKALGWTFKMRDKSQTNAQKAEGEQAAEAIAAQSPLVDEAGGFDALRNPMVGRRAGQFVTAANAIKKLTAQPKEEGEGPATVKKVRKGNDKVETETDTGEYVPPVSAYAHLDPVAGAARALKDALEAGQKINSHSGFKKGFIRNVTRIRQAAKGLQDETGLVAEDTAAGFEGVSRNGDPYAHRDWLIQTNPEVAHEIMKHFSDKMISDVWLKRPQKKK